jgi:hypothetical protein
MTTNITGAVLVISGTTEVDINNSSGNVKIGNSSGTNTILGVTNINSTGSIATSIANGTGALTLGNSTGGITMNSTTSTTLATASTVVRGTNVSGDTANRYQFTADGTTSWGSGSAAVDTTMNRTSTGALTISSTLNVATLNSNTVTALTSGSNLSIQGNGSGFVNVGLTGMEFQNTSYSSPTYTPASLNFYEIINTTYAFSSGSGGSGNSVLVTVNLVRLGRMASIYVAPITCGSTTAAFIQSNSTFPTRYQPTGGTGTIGTCRVSNNGTVTLGFAYFSSGVLQFFNGPALSPYTGTASLVNDFNASYYCYT